LAQAEKEIEAAKQAITAAEAHHRGAVVGGHSLTDAQQQLGSAIAHRSLVQRSISVAREELGKAEQRAREAYGQFVAERKAEALAKWRTDFETASTAWIGRAKLGLLELVAQHQALMNMSPMMPGYLRREIAAPLTFSAT